MNNGGEIEEQHVHYVSANEYMNILHKQHEGKVDISA